MSTFNHQNKLKRLSFYIFLVGFLFAIYAYGPGPSSAGAPASHTGAPGEATCATEGCHDDGKLNSGSALLSLQFEDSVKKILPGKTYSLIVRITDKNVNRFGFQLLALDSKADLNSGDFIITDSIRTKITTNRYKLQNRKYVTYTFNGTDAVEKGTGEWKVKWKAPEKIESKITFYLSGVSANDDMSDKGDLVYTRSYKIPAGK